MPDGHSAQLELHSHLVNVASLQHVPRVMGGQVDRELEWVLP